MRTLTTLVAALALRCAPAVVGTQNYGTTPEQQMRTAIGNMRAIAANACVKRMVNFYPYCESLTFDDEALRYAEKRCVSSQYQVHGNVGGMSCIADVTDEHLLRWDDMRKMYAGGNTVKVCAEEKGCVIINGFRSSEQAHAFARAVNMYVQGE
ncbi:MAG TPA: hypothetical protein VJI32_06005 [Candidatus Nanoarchaeia archaeon]|nr:hypothetical protein [Candidatus Nanoarchaeia archaeon]